METAIAEPLPAARTLEPSPSFTSDSNEVLEIELTQESDGVPAWVRSLVAACQDGEAVMKACVNEKGQIQALVVTSTVDDALWIHAVFTNEEFRRQRYAHRLIASVMSEAGCRTVRAALPSLNPGSQALFSGLGFHHVTDVLAWPSWETSSALHLSITQGLSVDLLVLHPPQEQEAHSIAHAAKVCATLEEACAALDACSPAPAHLRDFLPGERTLFPLTHSTMVAALSERRVWALPGPDGKPVAVLAGATTPRGMAIASVAAASPAGLEAALVAARLHLPRACRFYILAGCDPLRLMGDQFSITQIWERAAGHPAS
ncbi:hypothetical protein ACKKBG_A13260 [Auxenochlorella protothecoides x Auxenochlorella symbiontica]